MKVEINKDEINKFCIDNKNIIKLSSWIIKLEDHYSKLYNNKCFLDIEWAIDGITKELFLVQARPKLLYQKIMMF